jgi:hypothetical protein
MIAQLEADERAMLGGRARHAGGRELDLRQGSGAAIGLIDVVPLPLIAARLS